MDDHETKPPVIHLCSPFPTATSTIPELISYIRRSAHQKDSFEMVTKILLAREENLNNSVKEMSIEVVNRKNDLGLIENKHRQLVVEKVAIEDELKKCRFDCGELREKLMRSDEKLIMYVGRDKRADERYEKLVEDYREVEAQSVAWKKKYHDLVNKVLKLEQHIVGLVENEEEEFLGVNSSGNNHDNGRAINKQFVLDSRSPGQMMAAPILGNRKSEIIKLDDSDDDKPNGNGNALTTISASEPGAKETATHTMPNAKRASSFEILETDIKLHKMRRLQEMGHDPKISSSSFYTSNLGEKSLMDSFMEELVGNPQGERECEAWKYEVDMLQAFEKDFEICMNAVCAIYRLQKSKEKSSNPLMPCSNQGFRHFDVLSGTKLAELLIAGDPEGKLRKSVSDLQQHNPKALDECRKLARLYSKQLFQIYKSKKDPFFFPS